MASVETLLSKKPRRVKPSSVSKKNTPAMPASVKATPEKPSSPKVAIEKPQSPDKCSTV